MPGVMWGYEGWTSAAGPAAAVGGLLVLVCSWRGMGRLEVERGHAGLAVALACTWHL